jgi:hypothetical protein
MCVCVWSAVGERGTDTKNPLEVVNTRERWPRGCAQSGEHRQELHVGISVVVWELV